MKGYSAREVAAMLGLSEQNIRSFARSGFLQPERGDRGEYRFSFHDIVLLRVAKELTEANIPARKIRTSLLRLRQQLPSGRPLTAVRIAADGQKVVVRDGGTVWNPDSGQVLFDFGVEELASKAGPFARRAAEEAIATREDLSADEWYELAADLEITAPDEARGFYERALAIDSSHSESHVNLGRLLHEEGKVIEAAGQYAAALETSPDDSTAAFNLGVAFEDLGRSAEAKLAYEQAIRSDPANADAHYNLATLYEAIGDKPAALRHLKAYKKLWESGDE